MRDHEPRFWLPFKGVTKPVYAIPGNHDWYDALEGFVATFFTPEAARVAMRARIEADAGLSSTTDDEQLTWLRAALEAARGKMVMAILGHPFFAGGRDVSAGDEGFAALRAVLREHDVGLIMAGDTHDLEYYREPVAGPAGPATVHHWVNGGGGAYMSFGTALDFPEEPVTREWAYYPSRRDVTAKIEQFSPWWKRPAWIWTRDLGAWPSSPEWLSAMLSAAPLDKKAAVESLFRKPEYYGNRNSCPWPDPRVMSITSCR